MKDSNKDHILIDIYERLYKKFGPQHWWPADSPFEVMVGAILTQNTNWANVERAIRNLKKEKVLTAQKLKEINIKSLARLIRPAGYFNVKARRLKNFIDFIFSKYKGDLRLLKKVDIWQLRTELLQVKGIGAETADSILLYALDAPIFVIDAYTKRILLRHRLIEEDTGYSQVQDLFMNNLESDAKLFNEFHALIVRLGKEICKTKPNCCVCPLKDLKKELKINCDSCGRQLTHPRQRYILKIELYASPEVEITKEDLKKDSREEIKKLINKLNDEDPKKLEEEVYVKYNLNLCKHCRDIFNQRIKNKEFV
ncbi:MAG: endonuclease III domain-containing protein [Candidatus Omnitrophota bacterium]